MLKISDILEKMVKNDQQLEFFISNRLLNLSQFAKYVQPLVETQMQKEVQTSAIVMALSRLQKKTIKRNEKQSFKISKISLHTDLCTMSFNKSPSTHQKIQNLHNTAINESAYFTISESTSEITIIASKEFITNHKTPTPKYEHPNLSAIAVQFDPKYLSIPGVMTTIMQKLTLQNINFIEISSTCTEMTFYIDHDNLRLAFDTLHDSFLSIDEQS